MFQVESVSIELIEALRPLVHRTFAKTFPGIFCHEYLPPIAYNVRSLSTFSVSPFANVDLAS